VTKVNIVYPGLKFKYALDPPPSKVVYLVQHHMAHKSWGIHEVHDFHKNSRGWNGIGYNWWIGFDGTIYEGRGFHYGAGVEGHNHDSLHVGYQGDFTQQKMTDAQLASGIALNTWLMEKYPSAKVVGHKELASTSCPGQYFRMAELIQGLSRKEDKPVSNQTRDINIVSQWAASSWEAATKLGYFDGTRPGAPITREEMAIVIMRMENKK